MLFIPIDTAVANVRSLARSALPDAPVVPDDETQVRTRGLLGLAHRVFDRSQRGGSSVSRPVGDAQHEALEPIASTVYPLGREDSDRTREDSAA